MALLFQYISWKLASLLAQSMLVFLLPPALTPLQTSPSSVAFLLYMSRDFCHIEEAERPSFSYVPPPLELESQLHWRVPDNAICRWGVHGENRDAEE